MSNNRFKSFDSLATAVQQGSVAVDEAGRIAADVGALLRKIDTVTNDFNVDSMSDAELDDRIALARKRVSEANRERREQALARISHAERKARWRSEGLPESEPAVAGFIGRGPKNEETGRTPKRVLPTSDRPEWQEHTQRSFGLFSRRTYTCIKFDIIRAWSSEFNRLVETDNVRITRWRAGPAGKYGRGPEDTVWYSTRTWAREHYKSLLVDGYEKMF